jgi:hypothetical protein
MNYMTLTRTMERLAKIYDKMEIKSIPVSSKKAVAAIAAIRGLSNAFKEGGDIDWMSFVMQINTMPLSDIRDFLNEYLTSLYVGKANLKSRLFWCFFLYYAFNFPYSLYNSADIPEESALSSVDLVCESLLRNNVWQAALERESGVDGILSGDGDWEHAVIMEAKKEMARKG